MVVAAAATKVDLVKAAVRHGAKIALVEAAAVEEAAMEVCTSTYFVNLSVVDWQ